MTRLAGPATHLRAPSLHTFSKREFDDVPKSTVIAIAATATVLVVALISGFVICCVRRRRRTAKNKGHGKPRSANTDFDNQHDIISKTPLMRQENSSQTSQYPGIAAPRYDEEGDIAMSSPYMPQRTLSAASTRSLPPSYSAATFGSNSSAVRRPVPNPHRPSSSLGGSDGLRPLTLVHAQRNHDEYDRGNDNGRSRSRSPFRPEEASLVPLQPPGRPRAHSRFREEDLDM